jgi:hypothetical protein
VFHPTNKIQIDMSVLNKIWGGLIIVLIAFQVSCKQKEEVSAVPNILFVIADDLSYPHTSAYGTEWINTPGFDRVAREGLLFTRAYTPNAKCSPSRSIIITGRNS